MAKKDSKLSSLALFSDDSHPVPPTQEVPPKKEDEEKPKEGEEEENKPKEGEEEEKPPRKSLVPTDEEIEEGKPKVPAKEKDKGTQFAELRAKKDELEKENEELKKKLETGGGTYKPPEDLAEDFKPFAEEADPVAAMVAAHKATREENAKLKEQVEEQTGKLRSYDINNDPAFQKKYVEPFNRAEESLKLDIYKVDGTGNLVHPEKFGALYQGLLKQIDSNGGKVDATKVKAAMTQFKTDYEKETGETWDMPRPQDVVDGLRTLVSSYSNLQEGQKGYEQERAKLKEDSDLANQRAATQKAKEQAALRKTQSNEYIADFDFESHADLGTEKEIREKFATAFAKADGFISDPSTVPTFPEMVRNFMYLEEFENLRKENAKMKERLEELDDDGLGGGSEKSGKPKKKEEQTGSPYALFEG